MSSRGAIRVLTVDDHHVVRWGMVAEGNANKEIAALLSLRSHPRGDDRVGAGNHRVALTTRGSVHRQPFWGVRPAAPGRNLGRAVRRLFTTFPYGPPGVGLLLLRLVAGIALLDDAATALRSGLPLEVGLLDAISGALGVLLLAGLWTPFVGALVAVDALWNVFYSGHPWRWILVAALGAALTLLGPGVWSVDARLFGWRRLDLRARKGPPSAPQ